MLKIGKQNKEEKKEQKKVMDIKYIKGLTYIF